MLTNYKCLICGRFSVNENREITKKVLNTNDIYIAKRLEAGFRILERNINSFVLIVFW